jgi:hypothetical protein
VLHMSNLVVGVRVESRSNRSGYGGDPF